MPNRLFVLLLTVMALAGIAGQALAADEENPLDPLDTSSPRAAYLSFVEQANVIQEAALAYRTDRSFKTQGAYFDEVAKTGELSDLSEVPEASRAETVERNFAALADILVRIPPPDLETIPDADMVSADELTQWTLPGTEITYRPLKKGDRAGSWVLSSETVASLPGWRDEVDDLPILAEELTITDWRRNSDFSTGPLIPGSLIGALPDLAKSRVLGSPLWKSIVAVLGAMLIVLLAMLWYRWIGRRGPEDSIRRHIFGLTTPLFVLLLMAVYQHFMSTQVNHSGQLAELVVRGSTIAFWITVAWLFRELVALILEWVIATPVISSHRYDAHLLRLISRVISVIGIGIILLYGANEIGIPAVGLLAGASVGGLVVGLAAQSTIENLIGGMTLFADKPFQVGDFVGFWHRQRNGRGDRSPFDADPQAQRDAADRAQQRHRPGTDQQLHRARQCAVPAHHRPAL